MSQLAAESFYSSSIVRCHRFTVKINVKVLRTLKLKLIVLTLSSCSVS